MTTHLRDRLKTLTKPFHDEMEGAWLLAEASGGNIEKEEYISLLKILYSAVAPMEEGLRGYEDRFASYGLDIKRRYKAKLLLSDLKILGVTMDEFEKREPREHLTFEEAIGALYVFEGSTMGGMGMYAKLIKNDNLNGACSYFLPYQDKTLQMWFEFCEFLEKSEKEADQNAVILSACKTFLNLRALF